MADFAVTGLGFGDEGKGSTVNYLCSLHPDSLVVRYSGGHQAGHTVIQEGRKHIFSSFGSGTLNGNPTYWSKYCTINPVGIVKELDILLEKGASPLLYIDDDCPVTTPYDIRANQKRDFENGTCGVGVGTTIQREENHYSLKYKDLFDPTIFKIKLDLIKKYYDTDNQKDIDIFLNCAFAITRSKFIDRVQGMPEYPNYIFEGSQGLLLDQNIGFFPHVTRSNTGSKNIISMGFNPKLYLVTRAYQTRHGNGAMTNTEYPHNISPNIYESNVDNKYQGKFRVSLLDLDLLLYGINSDPFIRDSENRTLVITCLDQMKDEYRFTYMGKLVSCDSELDFISRIGEYLGIPNILYSKFPYSVFNKIEL
jgi:adenylosuccinate synthase